MFAAHHLLWYLELPYPFKLVPLSVFLVAVKCIFNRLSSFSCRVIHIKLFRDKSVSEHSLRTSTSLSSPAKKKVKKWNKKRKLQPPLHCTRPVSAWKSGYIENLAVTWTHHMSHLGLWVIFYLNTKRTPALPHTYRLGNFSQTEVTSSACLELLTVLKVGQSLHFSAWAGSVQQMWWDLS